MAYKLKTFGLSITDTCNLTCSICYMNGGPTGRLRMSVSKVREIVHDVLQISPSLRCICLGGGEPLTHPEIFQIIAIINELGLPIRLETNGTLLVPEVVRRLKQLNLDSVMVSLDGATPETHDRIRGSGSFQHTLEGIHNLIEASISFFINARVSPINQNTFLDLVKLASDLGAKCLNVGSILPAGRARTDFRQFGLSHPAYARVVQQVLHNATNIGVAFGCGVPTRYFGEVPKPSEAEVDEAGFIQGDNQGCQAGITTVEVMANGDVQPCGAIDVPAGNVYETSFIQIWNESPLLQIFRNRHNLRGICGVCRDREICGGCRARALGLAQDYLGDDPCCPIVALAYRDLSAIRPFLVRYPQSG